jgi:YNFM family putative membrane transporter
VGTIGVLGILSTLAFRSLLPPSRHFVPRRGLGIAHHRRALAKHFARPGLPVLFFMACVLMGSFVTLYNYIGYRLIAPPYNLSQSAIASIFIVYLTGVVASPWSGRMADAFGRGRVLIAGLAMMLAGVMLTLLPSLGVIATGIGLLTIGFFTGHSAASSWVGRLAREAKGQAAALYLLAYYLGSSIVGSIGGHFWTAGGWGGVVTLVVALLVVGLVLAWKLRVRERAGTA